MSLSIILVNSGRKWIGEIEHVAMLYEQLQKAGHRPWIACRRGYALEKHALMKGWKHIALNLNSRFHPFQDFADIRSLYRLCVSENVQILHVHRGKEHWLGVFVRILAGLPIVRTRHVVTPVKSHLLNRILYKYFTDHVICVSHATARGYSKGFKYLPELEIIHSAVDTDVYHPRHASDLIRSQLFGGREIPSDALIFGLFGRYQKIKGHYYFLKAAAIIGKEFDHAYFFMAGPRGERIRSKLIHYADSQPVLKGRVMIDGHRNDIPSVLASIDIGVIASIGSEGSSRIALEMMASGLPIIATRVGGIPEIDPQCPGFVLIKPGDVGELVKSMRNYMMQPDVKNQGIISRHYVINKNNPHKWIQNIINIYMKHCVNPKI